MDYQQAVIDAKCNSIVHNEVKLTALDLPKRLLDELRNHGIHSVEQLNMLSEDDLYYALRDIGSRAVDLVKEVTSNGYREEGYS